MTCYLCNRPAGLLPDLCNEHGPQEAPVAWRDAARDAMARDEAERRAADRVRREVDAACRMADLLGASFAASL